MIDGLKPYADCRDSGLPWLGKIPAHWEVRRTKTQFRLSIEKSGKAHGQELLSIYTHIGVRPRKDLEEKGNKASSTDDYWVVRNGDLIVNKLLAWMGAVGVSHYDGVTSPAYDILRPVKELVPDYYHYLFRTDLYKQQFKIRSRGIMEMRLRLYFDQFGQIPIPCPPPEEQAAIVRFLDHAERHIRRYIRAKRQLIALLNEQKQAIIHRAVTRGLDPHVKLKPSGVDWIGDVPEHWEVVKLSHWFRTASGSTPSRGKSGYYGGSIPWIKTGELQDGVILGSSEYLTEKGFLESSLTKLPVDSLLVAMFGQGKTRGRTGLLKVEATVNQACLGIVPNSGKMIPEYLQLWFKARYSYLRFISEARNATQPNLNAEIIRAQKVVAPPLGEQEAILQDVQNKTRGVDDIANRAIVEMDLLRQLHTRLVADIVTGKLDVREAAVALSDELEAVEPDAEELLDEDESTDDAEPEEIEA